MTPRESKRCATCGRTMTWRKKWEKHWDEVKYCSNGCRRRRSEAQDPQGLEAAILEDLGKRARGGALCPSEVVRARFEHWREMMGPVREAACRLEAAGTIEILQKGKVVDPSRARGPIRLRRVE